MRFVNSYQTQKERRKKYKLCLEHGATTKEARCYRDFTRGHIESIAIPYLVSKMLVKLAGRKNANAIK